MTYLSNSWTWNEKNKSYTHHALQLSTILGHKMSLLGRYIWPKVSLPTVVWHLDMRCLYGRYIWPKAGQMSSWPQIVPLLDTRCLYQEGWGRGCRRDVQGVGRKGMFTSARIQLLAQFLQVQTPSRSGGCGNENHIHVGYTYIYKGPDNTIDQVCTLEYKTSPSPHNH